MDFSFGEPWVLAVWDVLGYSAAFGHTGSHIHFMAIFIVVCFIHSYAFPEGLTFSVLNRCNNAAESVLVVLNRRRGN